MIFYIPQWQGAGNKFEIPDSLNILKNQIINFPINEINLSNESSEQKNGINHYDVILNNLIQIKKSITQSAPQKMFTIGGECSIELIPVSYLNKIYNGNLNILWFDAHGDLNTNISSSSNNFHGMPLRLLLGEGENNIKNDNIEGV